MVNNEFSSDESTRESEFAIDGFPTKIKFLDCAFSAEWLQDIDPEKKDEVHLHFLQYHLFGFMKRMMSYKNYKRLTPEQKQNIDQSLKLLFLEEPNMSKAEDETIKKYCNSDTELLEFGSGMSTLHHAMRCKYVVSVESDPYWYTRVLFLLCVLDLQDNVLPLMSGGPNYENSFADIFPNKKYDVVSIDGKKRLECAESVLPYIHDDSVVIFSDFWRDKRHKENNFSKVFEWYDVVESCEKGNTYVVLKRKKGYPWA